MISRRDFLQTSMAAAALYGGSGFGNWGRLAAQQSLTQSKLLEFETFGNVSLIHVTDIHAQMKPIFFREPEINIGVGANRGQVPHVTGADFRKLYGINDGSASAYALTYNDFSALAKGYGRVGGLDRVATVINQIRAERPDALLLDGGRYLAWLLHLPQDRGPRYGQCHECFAPRCDDLPLGVHPGQRAGQ